MANAPYKMVLAVNKSLKMGNGKIAAQCCHAAVGCYKRASRAYPSGVRAWEYTGCAKVAVKIQGEKEVRRSEERSDERQLERSDSQRIIPPSCITNNFQLVASLLASRPHPNPFHDSLRSSQEVINQFDEIIRKCSELGVAYYLVEDAGRTQIEPGSKTVVGVGPAPVDIVDQITSEFKLM